MTAAAVRIVEPDAAILEAAVAAPAELRRVLGCDLADGWDVFPEALRATRDAAAADPGSTRWGARFFVLEDPRTLVGWGGFKGPPQDGTVELGYAVAPRWEGRGLATAAVAKLLEEAFAHPGVRAVIAHTLPEAGASGRVLEKNGFVRDGDGLDPEVGTVWRYKLARPAPAAPSG